MLFQGFMLVPSEFPDWLEWVYYIAFHTYAWRTFMVNEFRNTPELTGSNFKSGEDVLVFYEIEDVNRSNDMIVLAGYCIFLHMLACIVLLVRYHLHGTITPITEKEEGDIKFVGEKSLEQAHPAVMRKSSRLSAANSEACA